MPILVTCGKCKAQFKVSEKFAGKQGPCPKCKAVITIPELAEEVKIHTPEVAAPGGKTVAGQTALKPITRKETSLAVVPTAVAIAGTLAVLAVAWVCRDILQKHVWLRAVGLLLISPAIVRAGYAFLREEELEPHRGWVLWLRSAICGTVYVCLWGVLHLLLPYVPTDPWYWIFVAPPLLLAGAGIALATLDLDLGNGFFHYCFYVLVTLALGWLAGLQMPWLN